MCFFICLIYPFPKFKNDYWYYTFFISEKKWNSEVLWFVFMPVVMQLVYKLKTTSSSKDETYKRWLQVQFGLFTSWEVWGKEFQIWDSGSMMASGV